MNNVRSYTDKEILAKVKSVTGFKEIPKDYFVVGIRSKEDAENTFDDKFYLFKGETFIAVTTGTTNPGTPGLKGGFLKYNKEGSAVVKADKWYYKVWRYGLHNGKMPALVQVNPITVHRDGDKDGKSEELGDPKDGLYGINFHSNTYDPKTTSIKFYIGEWSMGCQVVNNKQEHLKWVALMKTQPNVSYCLLNEF